MICPQCGSQDEMAYSSLSNGFVCIRLDCGFEIEMDAAEAREVLQSMEELVCCV